MGDLLGGNMTCVAQPEAHLHTLREGAWEELCRGKITRCTVAADSEGLLITRIDGEPFGRYYEVVATDQMDDCDREELRRLEQALPAPLKSCIVMSNHVMRPHPYFPGSRSYTAQTIYPPGGVCDY